MTAVGWRPGAKIEEDGAYPLVPMEDYHGQLTAGHSVSHTSLERILMKSPLHFYDKWYGNPDRAPDEPTAPMILGRAAHHLFLGEREFQKHFIRRPEEAPDGRQWHGSNKYCIEWMQKHEAKGLTILTPETLQQITGMARALKAHPMVKSGILSGRIETTLVCRDHETGLYLKSRPDVIPSDGDFVDLKIVSDISEEGIQQSIERFGYHRQASLTLECASRVFGWPLIFRGPGEGEENGMSASLLLIESVRPHAIEVVTFKPADLKAGMEENRAAIRLVKRCITENDWPGPSLNQKDARYFGLSERAGDRNKYRVAHINSFLKIHGAKIK